MPFSDARPCGATTRGGRPCEQPGMRTNGRCRMHGGKTPTGLANPNTRSGRYSRDMPTRLAARFVEARRDPSLLSIRDDVAFVSAVISEKMAELDGVSSPDWTDVIERVEEIAEKWMTWDRTKIDKKMREVAAAAGQKQNEQRLMTEILDLIGKRKDLVQAENKRLMDMKQMLSVEQIMMIGQSLVDVVRSAAGDDERGRAMLKTVHSKVRDILTLRPKD